MASFSLVRDEPLSRWFGLVGLRGYRGPVLLAKALITAAMTYLPLALLAVAQDAWLRSQGVMLELTLAAQFFRSSWRIEPASWPPTTAGGHLTFIARRGGRGAESAATS